MSPDPKKQESAPPAPAGGPPAGKPAAAPATILEVDAAVRAIGFIFYNTVNARWFSASDRKQTIQESHSVLATVLGKLERLRFTADGKDIKVNGDSYEAGTVHVRALAAHLSSMAGCNFTFTKGLTLEEFTDFMALICNPESELTAMGGLIEAVTKRNFQHVSSKHIVLKEVSEEEVVVSKTDMEGMAAEERQKIESDVLSLLSAAAPPEQADAGKSSSLRKVMQDSDAMAGLIMQAVDKKGGEGSTVAKQEVAKIVVDCLDRAFAALLDDPFSKTQKGKKAIAGALQRLEGELLAKMKVAPEQEEAQQVTTAVERMTERLKMDSIVQEYSKKLKSLEDSEKRILRFIKLQGLDKVTDPEIEKRLSEEGVDISDWQRLLAKGGAGEDGHAAVTQLATLLDRLEHDVSQLGNQPDARTQEQVAGDLKQVDSEVRALTGRTQAKIEGLVEAVQADMAEADALELEAARNGHGLKLSRRRMLTVLAEVVQEMKQPLVVIACALDMIKSKSLGEVNPAQAEMLQMTEDSADRIKTLIDHLEGISGHPATLHPDKEIQANLNR